MSLFTEDTPTPQTCLPHMTFFSPTQSVLVKNVPRFLGKSGPHGEIILCRVRQGPHICALSHNESARGHLVYVLTNLYGLTQSLMCMLVCNNKILQCKIYSIKKQAEDLLIRFIKKKNKKKSSSGIYGKPLV